MSLKIYAMTHKKYNVYQNPVYIPLQVGRATSKDLGYLGDDTGDNISIMNCYYAELTGVYWMWKNCKDADYVGVCHYRRYLVNEKEKILSEAECMEIMKEYDVITSKKLKLNYTYAYGFQEGHDSKDLIETGKVIQEKYPEYYEYYDHIIHGYETYFGNIMVTSKTLFDEYATWLFDILFEVQKRIDVESYDDYRKRVFGFISEILLYVWVTKRKCKVYECKVGIVGEKFETKEVKKQVENFLAHQDLKGAKEYFTAYLKKRPDILMEASDVNGELKLTMQAIATCDIERRSGKRSIIDETNDIEKIIHWFRELNAIVERFEFGRNTNEDMTYLKKQHISFIAIDAAITIVCKDISKIVLLRQQIGSIVK